MKRVVLVEYYITAPLTSWKSISVAIRVNISPRLTISDQYHTNA